MPEWALSWLVEGGMLTVFAGVAWRVIKRLNREETLHSDFPPHRHVNGTILYPREYEPGHIDHVHINN